MIAFLIQLQEVVRHLNIVGEIIELAVISVVLYQILRLLRGTQGTQILVGLVVLTVIGVLSTTFNLVLLSWLFKNGAPYLVIAIIVMFQLELLRSLDHIGRFSRLGHPLSAFSTPEYSQAISETIRAA